MDFADVVNEWDVHFGCRVLTTQKAKRNKPKDRESPHLVFPRQPMK